MSLFDQISSNIAARASAIGKNLTSGAAASSLIGAAVGKIAPGAYNAARALQRGDVSALVGAGVSALTGKLGSKSPLANPEAARLFFQASPNPLMGGLRPEAAARMAAEARAMNYARKNLWFIEITDPNPPKGYEGISKLFNMFATDVSFGTEQITSEGKAIGMGVVDAVTGLERTEMRLTTLDDANGSIRGWFDGKRRQVAHTDGTVGVPLEYLVRIRLVESAITDDTIASFGGYERTFVMRATSLDTELSRGEEGMQQLQLVLTQFDTFMFRGSV